jgi:hypothetical protein
MERKKKLRLIQLSLLFWDYYNFFTYYKKSIKEKIIQRNKKKLENNYNRSRR